MKRIQAELNELIPDCKVHLMRSVEKEHYAVIYGNQMWSIDLVREMYQKLEADCLSNLKALKLKERFWEYRDEIDQEILKQELGVIH